LKDWKRLLFDLKRGVSRMKRRTEGKRRKVRRENFPKKSEEGSPH